jgi:hypothetical protein
MVAKDAFNLASLRPGNAHIDRSGYGDVSFRLYHDRFEFGRIRSGLRVSWKGRKRSPVRSERSDVILKLGLLTLVIVVSYRR